MRWFKKILSEHTVAIGLAVCASLLVAAPQIYFRIEHKNDGIYQGIELLPDSPRSALTREVLDGHPSVANVYYKDGKDGPYLWQPLQPMVVAYMGEMFSFDINNAILLSRLVLSFVVFLLMYGFVYLLSRDKLAALSSVALLILADSILDYSGFSQLLHGISPDNFLRISRPVDPVMTYIPLFAFLIVFWLFLKRRDWRYGALSAVLLGLNFYNYFYSWTFLYAFGGLLVLLYLIQKNWQEVVRIGSVFIGGLLVAVPYMMNLHRAILYPTYRETSERFGLILTHAPIFVGFTAIGALAAFFFGFPKEDRERYLFSLALLLTPFITLNQQLITGEAMQPAHYHWFFHKPLSVIFIILILFHVLTRWRLGTYKKALAVLIVAVSIGTGIFVQWQSYYHDSRDGGAIAIERQKYGPVMKWLSDNAKKESVVFANDETSHMTVIYTPLNVFYHRVAMNSLTATKARLLDVLFTFYRLRGIEAKDAREIFFKERYYISWSLYGIYYRELLGSYEAIPDEKIEEALNLYTKTLSEPASGWLKSIFAKYEVEYVVWDKKSDPTWQVERYPFLKTVATFGDITIFRVSPVQP